MNRFRRPVVAGAFAVAALSCGALSTPHPDKRDGQTADTTDAVQPARIVIDANARRHRVDPLIFGMHIEWVDNGVGLLEADSLRLRPAVIELLRPLKIPLFRFPGGIHADYYNWRLGIGPAASRGTSRNVFTKQSVPHRFGSDEFAALLEATGAEGLVTANFGTGTAAEAGAWAAYLRDDGADVRLWEVGNEIYLADPESDQPNGREIYRSPESYATAFAEYRTAIRKAVPEARVGAIAHVDNGAFPLAPARNRDWSEKMLRRLDTRADFFSVHNAYAPVILDDSVNFDRDNARRDAYRSLFAAAQQTADNLTEIAELIDRISPTNKGAKIAVTELGPFFGLSGDRETHAQYVDQTRTLAAALYTASILHVLIDDPRVFAACYTNPIHPWYGGLITDTDQGLIRTPTYYLYLLYRSRFEAELISTSVSGPTFNAPRTGIVNQRNDVPALLAQASVSDDQRRLTVMMVNRDMVHPLATTVEIAGFKVARTDCRVLSAPSPAAINGPALTSSTVSGASIEPRALDCTAGEAITLEIPPNAVVSLVVDAD